MGIAARMKLFHKIRVFLFLLTLSMLLGGCGESGPEEKLPEGQVKFDLLDIQRRGKIVALCRYNSISYFLYRGRPMGYEYELLQHLADHMGVELEIKVPRSWEKLYQMLYSGEGDIIAANMTVTLERSQKAAFTKHHTTTRQMLVQRKPRNWRKMKIHKINKQLIRDPIQLVGKKIHVQKNSAYYHRLMNLSKEIGAKIEIVTVPEDMEVEFLIKMVSDGLIDYTVADENMVSGYVGYYSVLDAKTPISFPQRIAWAVRHNAPQLLKSVNSWIHQMKTKEDPVYYVIYNRYFKNRRAIKKRLASDYLTTMGGRISPYDSLFRVYSEDIGWDWKLVAALAFQESRFSHDAVSWAGAIGVMQILPGTAEELRVREPTDPAENIKAGVKLLKIHYAYWDDIPDRSERIKFTLASYNAGQGHIQDARRLARKYGKDPDTWSRNVAEFLLRKSERKYFYDDVVRYGYCRGEEPYNYVKEILARYEIYKHYEVYSDEEEATSSLETKPSGVGRL
jgi:membrane-bound lytic murein transglycosylase F